MASVFKRAELWIFLVVSVGVCFYVFRQTDRDETPSAPVTAEIDPVAEKNGQTTGTVESDPEQAKEVTAPIRVAHVSAEAVEQGQIIHVTLLGRSVSGSELELGEETVKAATASGEPLPLFFEPFQAPAVLSPETEREVLLKFWMRHPDTSMSLVIQETSLKVNW